MLSPVLIETHTDARLSSTTRSTRSMNIRVDILKMKYIVVQQKVVSVIMSRNKLIYIGITLKVDRHSASTNYNLTLILCTCIALGNAPDLEQRLSAAVGKHSACRRGLTEVISYNCKVISYNFAKLQWQAIFVLVFTRLYYSEGSELINIAYLAFTSISVGRSIGIV